MDVWAAGLQLPSIADVDLGETSSSSEEEEGGVAPGFNVDKALEAQVARLSSSSSSSSSMPPEQLAIRADALTDFNVPEALSPGGLGGLARAVLAASPRVMLPRHSPLPAAAAAAPDGGGLMLLVRTSRTGPVPLSSQALFLLVCDAVSLLIGDARTCPTYPVRVDCLSRLYTSQLI